VADQWLTYEEAGAALGISAEAARRHAVRHRWPRHRRNDGRALIKLPEPEAGPVRTRAPAQPQPSPPERTPERPAGQDGPGLAALSDALRQAQDAARAAAAEAEAQRERAARAEGEALGLREAVRVAEDGRREAEARAERADERAGEVGRLVEAARREAVQEAARAVQAEAAIAEARRQAEAAEAARKALAEAPWWRRLLGSGGR
jgi:hypothetical protein